MKNLPKLRNKSLVNYREIAEEEMKLKKPSRKKSFKVNYELDKSLAISDIFQIDF